MSKNYENNTIYQHEAEDDFNIKQFFLTYLRFWYVYVFVLSITLSMAYFYNWFAKPVYNVSAKILIKDDKSTSIGTEDILKDLNVYSVTKNIENEIEIFKSRQLLKEVVERLELDVLYYLVGNVKKSEMYTESPFKITYDSLNFYAYNNYSYITILDENQFELSYEIEQTKDAYKKTHSFGEKIYLPIGIITVNKRALFDADLFNNPSYDKRDFRIKFNNTKNNIDFYQAKLNIALLNKQSSVILISIEDVVPQRGLDFINTLIDVYLEHDVKEKNKIASSTANFINDQLTSISEDLKTIEIQRQNFKIEKGITDVSNKSQQILERVKLKDNEISNINLQLSFIAYLQKYVQENKSISNIAPSSLGINDPLLVRLITQITDLEIEKQKLEQSYNQETPAIVAINNKIKFTRSTLLQNIESIKTGLQTSKKDLQVSMNSLENEMGTIPKTERELVGIEREYRVKESLYLYLLQKEAETSIALAASVSDNRIIEEARSTSYPIRPIPKKSYSLALLLGLLIPTGVIFVFEQFNDTVRDKKTIEKLTKIPMLGIVGYSKEHYALVVSEKPKSLIAESFRTVRTNLKYFLKGKEKETILITSSIGSEGKTFSSMNLSIIIALSGKKTVLLGLDLRKPKIVADFEISNDKGVSSFLIGAETIASIIQKTSVENLSIIPSGPIPPNPSELIMGEKMDELINKLQQDFDTIIIDSPPVGLVTDALLLSKYADATIFVVRQNVTKKEYLTQINQLYKEERIKNPSIIFNAVKLSGLGYGLGYGYGYGYGYYEEDQKKGFFNRIFKKK